MKKRRLSITHVVLLAMLIVAVLTWGFCATEYAQSVDEFYNVNPLRRTLHIQGDGRFRYGLSRWGLTIDALRVFAVNSITQIPRAPQVVSYTFQNRLWVVITFAVLETLVLGGGLVLKSVERNLAAERRRRPL